jgi:hypothetical protein
MDRFEQMKEFRIDRILLQAYSFTPYQVAQTTKNALGVDER